MGKRAPHNPNWKAEQRALARRARSGLIHDKDAKTLVFGDRQMARDERGTLRRTTGILKAHETVVHAKDNSPEIKGLPFYSQTRKRHMMLVTAGEWDGWLISKHPDGQWVSLRRATEADRAELAKAASAAHHQE